MCSAVLNLPTNCNNNHYTSVVIVIAKMIY